MNIDVSARISDEDIDDFREQFGEEIRLKGASYECHGDIEEFKYSCDHKLLKEFRNSVQDWLKNRGLPLSFTIINSNISLHTHEELSSSQIHSFENEFGIKYRGYSISCGSKNMKYEFS